MTPNPAPDANQTYHDRLARVRQAMVASDIDTVLLSVGAELPWLIGYEAMPLERLTMLVVPADGDASLVIPRLEAARVTERGDAFSVVPWNETEDPVAIVADLMGPAPRAAIGDLTWSRFLLALQNASPATTFSAANDIVGPLRARKDAFEIEALRAASAAVDRIAVELQAGNIALVGRTEAEVSADLGRRIVAEGHDRVNFAIVAAGENAASPHHEAGSRVIKSGEIVLCDFGGTMGVESGTGYCSDVTRCVHIGEPPAAVREAYDALFEAQAASVAAATVGTPLEDIDAAGRNILEAAGYGEYFVHRTGHGIGVEAHEDPYVVAGNTNPLEVGHAFSVEPGIYIEGQFGMRLEDIVVATENGPDPLNRVDHHLAIVDG